jgi:hypothetical protein
MTSQLDIALTDPQLYSNGFPHDVFSEFRRRGAVQFHPAIVGRPGIPSVPFWSVVTHPEIQSVNRDWKTFGALDGPMIGPAIHALDPRTSIFPRRPRCRSTTHTDVSDS